MRAELLQAVASVLSHAASIGDQLVGHARALSSTCTKMALTKGRAVECPYCRELIRAVDDHVMWCDMADSLREPLSNSNTTWPVIKFGVSISREWAEALTKPTQGTP